MRLPPSTITNHLWITRRKRGIPRKKLAALIGHKSTSQLCRWEDGSQIPNLSNALLLSHILQMPVEFLFKDLRDELVHRLPAFQGARDDP